MPETLDITHFTDPGCPWAYSASPDLALLHWRYGDQLKWRHVMIGLAEDAQLYLDRGYSPSMMAINFLPHRRWGMPFSTPPRERVSATGLACRAVVAARLRDPAREYDVFRALQYGQFTTTRIHDTVEGLRASLEEVDGLDVEAIIAATREDDVEAAYQEDRALARTAEGRPIDWQGKAFNSDGKVRYTAPSLIFRTAEGDSLEAGGFQSIEAYDVCIANLTTKLERRPYAEDPVEVVAALPFAPTTREVAMCMSRSLGAPPDDVATATALLEATGSGRVRARAVGDGTVWSL